MFPTQNPEVLPRYNTNSPIYSPHTEEESYVKEYLKSVVYKKMYDYIKEESRSTNPCFFRSVPKQWKNFLNRFIEIFDDSQSSNVYLKNRILQSIFNFNRKIEIRNIDLHYIFYSLKLVEKNKEYISKLPAEAVIASLFKSSLPYSKSVARLGPTYCENLEETLVDCFHISQKDLAVCDSIITNKSVLRNCMDMKLYEYVGNSDYLCQDDCEVMTEYNEIGKKTKKRENIISHLTAQEMAYLESDEMFSEVFTKPCALKEMSAFVDDILEASIMDDEFKNDWKCLLIEKFVKLNKNYKFTSRDVNCARIYLERLLEIDRGSFESENPLAMFISILGISTARNRGDELNNLQAEMLYIVDMRNLNPVIKRVSNNIIITFNYRSRGALDISYVEYLNYLKSHY